MENWKQMSTLWRQIYSVLQNIGELGICANIHILERIELWKRKSCGNVHIVNTNLFCLCPHFTSLWICFPQKCPKESSGYLCMTLSESHTEGLFKIPFPSLLFTHFILCKPKSQICTLCKAQWSICPIVGKHELGFVVFVFIGSDFRSF